MIINFKLNTKFILIIYNFKYFKYHDLFIKITKLIQNNSYVSVVFLVVILSFVIYIVELNASLISLKEASSNKLVIVLRVFGYIL